MYPFPFNVIWQSILYFIMETILYNAHKQSVLTRSLIHTFRMHCYVCNTVFTNNCKLARVIVTSLAFNRYCLAFQGQFINTLPADEAETHVLAAPAVCNDKDSSQVLSALFQPIHQLSKVPSY